MLYSTHMVNYITERGTLVFSQRTLIVSKLFKAYFYRLCLRNFVKIYLSQHGIYMNLDVQHIGFIQQCFDYDNLYKLGRLRKPEW